MANADDIESWLIARLSSALDVSADRLDGTTDFDDLCIDSITRAALIRELIKHFRMTVKLNAIYDYHTIRSLSEHLASSGEQRP